jgi:hypothetical protein
MVEVEVLFGIASDEAGARRRRGLEVLFMVEVAELVRVGPDGLSLGARRAISAGRSFALWVTSRKDEEKSGLLLIRRADIGSQVGRYLETKGLL